MSKYNIICQYHPAAALHQPYLWASMLDDWVHLPEKVDASYTVNTCPSSLPKLFSLDTENDAAGKLGAWSIAYRDEERKLCVCPFEYAKPNFIVPDDCRVIYHNAKWDTRVLRNNNMLVPKNFVDTMIAAYTLGHGKQDPKDTGKSGDRMVGGLGLKYLGRRHLGMQMKSWNDVKDHPAEMLEYNAADSVATYLLWEKWEKDLPQHFWAIDMLLLPVLMKMEDRGILVDSNFLQEYAKTLDERLKEIDLKGINPYSPDQVADYVYNKLGYQVTKKTETGKPSTDKEVLESIDDPIVQGILEYREVYKERKTYVGAYAERMSTDGRIHCEFKQVSTVTGRLSSANPNLQNVTKGSLRKLFIPSPGKLLVVLDWQQIELRVFATLVQEQKMLDALHAGRSIHQETADVLNIPYDDGKVINFLMLYGGGAWKISQEFHVPIDDAHSMLSRYYKAYPGIKIYHERQREIARTERQVTTWSGRTRRLDGMYSEDKRTIHDAENLAINLPVQGTAGEIVKLAMIDLDKKDAPMLLSVHDELLFEVETSRARDYGYWLKEYVPTITEINGEKFPVDVGTERNWFEAKEKENLLK